MRIFKDRFLILAILFGLLLRIILISIPGFKFDVDTWFSWAERLNTVGIAKFYSDQIWTGYPPGFLYILGILGFTKNLFQIGSLEFLVVLKLPSILAEILIGLIVYKIIPTNFGNWRKLGLIFVMLNPAFIFNSSIFGQFDGLFSLTLLLSIYFLKQTKFIHSSILSGISFLLKPQAILLFPIFSLYIFKNTKLFFNKRILDLLLASLIIIIFGFFPFFASDIINGPIKLVKTLLDYYPYNSIFAFNLWGILGFWIPDTNRWVYITYQNWGYILFGGFWAIVAFIYLWKKKNISLYTLSALSALSFFFLLTRMHERYLYPSLIFLIIVTIFKKSRSLALLSVVLSFIYLLDLYYVYIYYNLFYLNLPTILYNQAIYEFTDKNTKLISLFSTFIFILISAIVLKLNYESKNT